MNATSVETLGPACFLIRGAVGRKQQVVLFDFIQENDGTDWDGMPSCMNPSPKTLAFVSNTPGAEKIPTLFFQPDDEAVVVEMVGKLIGNLNWSQRIKSVSMAAIRYCSCSPTIGSVLPPHVDHCNDGSWVFVFSLGCAATFYIKSPGMEERHTFEMKSGDALVFNPSSEAGILHGVAGVREAESCERGGLGERFEVMRGSRYGVQCRVSFC